MENKATLLSGIKPTGDIHLGNYFGAMRQFLDLQDQFECFIFIANLHALNQIHDADILKANTLEIAKAYLSVGLDPNKVHFFKQSDIPQVSELCWIFNSITNVGLMERAHAYKDFVAKNGSGGAAMMGLFDYPILMAADILIYESDIVPVGKDQQQHLEMAVDIAGRFNHIFGETFKMPEGRIGDETATVIGLDGRKMSKSYGNTIGLFDAPETLKKKISSIKTDSKGIDEPKDPDTDNIFALYRLVADPVDVEQLKMRYIQGGVSYKEAKDLLYEALVNFLAPIQAKKKELDENEDYVLKVLNDGREVALERAEQKLREIKTKVGI